MSPAEIEYREQHAAVQQHLAYASPDMIGTRAYAHHVATAQVHATLALAAATLMAAEGPRFPDRGVAEVLDSPAMRAAVERS